MSRELNYTRYTTVLRTVNNGTIVGKLDQHLNEVVTWHYGAPHGYLPWSEDGCCGLIVKPPETIVVRPGGGLPKFIRTEQEIVDWVTDVKYRPERGGR